MGLQGTLKDLYNCKGSIMDCDIVDKIQTSKKSHLKLEFKEIF